MRLLILSAVACTCSWFFFVKQKTAYEMRISDWSSDVCSSDLAGCGRFRPRSGDAGSFDHFRDQVEAGLHGGGITLVAVAVVGFCDLEIGRASCRERVCQ